MGSDPNKIWLKDLTLLEQVVIALSLVFARTLVVDPLAAFEDGSTLDLTDIREVMEALLPPKSATGKVEQCLMTGAEVLAAVTGEHSGVSGLLR